MTARMTPSVQEAMRVLSDDYDLPGPFAVLQGIPGDGMANTIDTMPELVIGNSNEDEDESDSGDPNDEVANEQTSFESVPREISENHSSLASNEHEHSDNSHSTRGNSDENGDVFSIVGANSETSSLEIVMHPHVNSALPSPVESTCTPDPDATTRMNNAITNDNRATLNQGSRFSPRGDGKPSIGLHLPLPMNTGVAPIGYNSILPPVNTNHAPPSLSPQRNEEFIIIDERKNLKFDKSTTPPDNALALPTLSNESPAPSSSFATQRRSPNSSRYELLSAQNKQSIKDWNSTCRENETMQLNDVLNHSSSNASSLLYGNQWWKSKRHCLLIFDEAPTFKVPENEPEKDDKESCLQHGKILGELEPGATVVGVERFSITAPKTNGPSHKNPKQGVIEVLKIESPQVGFIIYSVDGYALVGPGLPSSYTESDVWLWKVMCTSGAYVRQGLELTSVHVDTIPYGSFVQITRKTINAMGLSRLKVEAYVRTESDANNDDNPTKSSAGLLNGALQSLTWRSRSTSTESGEKKPKVQMKKVVGWVSEALNPLSGQTGPVVQPVPFPVPAQYNITLPGGAVIREGVELSSNEIGLAPMGSILNIVGRAYSQHPMDRCIQRLKLAGGGGWVSVQLNKQTAEDQLSVLEQVGTGGSYDHDEPGVFHIEKQLQVMDEYHTNVNDPDDTDQLYRTNVRRSLERLISSVSSNDEDETLTNSADISNNDSSLESSAVPALYRSGVANPGGSQSTLKCGSKSQKDEPCLICLTEDRNATIVHGETGHIACCLTCARLLKGRGDKCPVCRLPIDMIIQQFWA